MTVESVDTARNRPLVAIESPYAGDVKGNEEFARRACRHAIEEGYAPFAMHLLYPQFLDDQRPEERTIGIGCGLAWTANAREVWFCLREGEDMTSGMLNALDAESARRGTDSVRPVRMLRFTREGAYLHDY